MGSIPDFISTVLLRFITAVKYGKELNRKETDCVKMCLTKLFQLRKNAMEDLRRVVSAEIAIVSREWRNNSTRKKKQRLERVSKSDIIDKTTDFSDLKFVSNRE